MIKATLISTSLLKEIQGVESLQVDESTKEISAPETVTIEHAIKSCLQSFFDKRRASGDVRPCGPHDMGPIYQAIFGITKEDLKNEKFLSRLRRTGLGQSQQKDTSENVSSKHKQKKK